MPAHEDFFAPLGAHDTHDGLKTTKIEAREPKTALAKLLNSHSSTSSSTSSLNTLALTATNDSFAESDSSLSLIATTTITPSHHPTTIASQHSNTLNDLFQHQSPRPNTTSILRPGSTFIGAQQSGRSTYQVEVELKYVDLDRAYLNGYLKIKGLTETNPEIVTFFESDIVSEHYSFFTSDSDLGSSDEIDIQHWSKFANWKETLPTKKILSKNYIHKNFDKKKFMYMRWKEKFLVPDAKVDNIEGASFAGFYYINFNQATGDINGLYYHKSSEKFQQLELSHVSNYGVTSSFQFA